jgi:CHAT domain-containing protein
VTDYRTAMAARAFGTKKTGAALHDLLLARVRAKAGAHTNRLLIVPDDSLWELPFHTLVDRRGRYVIEDAVVAYAPSLATLREMTALARRRASEPVAIELLAVGDPSPAEGPRVPHAAREVNALASIYGASRSRVYVGARADEARFREQAGQARRVHVAAHGVLDSRAPLHSYVALAPGAAGDDGLLEARELMRQRLRAELLVLSACETARGRIGAGEGLIGFGWAAFLAGSASTLVSQWKVDSRSTADLMIAFHRALQPDASGRRLGTADALRRAALATARTPAYAHPFYWAGFVAIGDPR